MAKWFKDYLSFGSRRSPPQPPKPDYTESEILKAYRAQKSLDFEDPYEDGEGKADPDPGGSPNKGSVCGGNLEGKYGSPKHRLIKVDASDLNRSKALLASAAEEAAAPLEKVTAPQGEASTGRCQKSQDGMKKGVGLPLHSRGCHLDFFHTHPPPMDALLGAKRHYT
ncbi:SH2 domain-containing adapter protein D-like [Python bivittatus]|uniref:SH2 domain-containing adapter protein D-like n=1 Tax=Python bivittatus TaxID=176946 RepID=A0A9F5J8N1_PYTBI|nr:SH2 domain-containing adapter protein D-like [Python bivittatus]